MTAENPPRVAIIGAGPAGCAAAFSLRHSGFRVTIFERGEPSKDKPCGDAFIPSAVANLLRLGFDERELVGLGGIPFRRYFLGWDDLDPIEMTGAGYVIPRAALDQALRDKIMLHAEIRYGSAVRDLRPLARGGWTLRVGRGGAEGVFDAVIVAAGAASSVASEFSLSGASIDIVALTSYVQRPLPEVPTFLFEPGGQPGYSWQFPTAEGVNMGVCALSVEGNRGAREKMRNFMCAPAAVRGGIGRLWSGQGTTWHHPAGLLTCGDAAGLVDPVTGEGISGALASGLVAGVTVQAFLDSGRIEERLQSYSRWVRQYFAGKYQLNPSRERFARLAGLQCASCIS